MNEYIYIFNIYMYMNERTKKRVSREVRVLDEDKDESIRVCTN